MAQNLIEQSEVSQISSLLLSTLDEKIFFSELSCFIKNKVMADGVKVFKVLDDNSAVLISKSGDISSTDSNEDILKGSCGHVIRTKRPYFSNNVERDPIFNGASNGVKAELCVPVIHEGILIATMHFQIKSSDRGFSREDLNNVLSILNDLKQPISNIKMYLSAKSLNEILLKKIELKEKELEERTLGISLSNSFRVEEKEIIGKSDNLKKVLEISDKLAASDVNVLIEGESGSGKEILARRIHCRSQRKSRSFLVVDCSSLSEDRLEIELFGHSNDLNSENFMSKKGILESANNGSIFFKKIELLSNRLQSKLIHVIKEGIALRIGESNPYRVNIRFFTSTSSNLSEMVKEGRFREDLFFALSNFSIQNPSLKERKEDIELLSYYFLNEGKCVDDHKSLSPCVISALKEYFWPGNIRELQNIIERAYILADGLIVERVHIADSITFEQNLECEEEQEQIDFSEMTLEELERVHICNTLDHLNGNKTKTAKVLGITVKTLYNKLHSYGMISAKNA